MICNKIVIHQRAVSRQKYLPLPPILYVIRMEDNQYRILVVDDEADLCDILQFNLCAEGYIIDVAYSAEEALTKDLGAYDLLLLDVMMGEMSGFELAERMKQSPLTAHIPIIFLTARDTEDDTVTGLNLGADDYISKPFSIREVLARVKAVLRRAEQHEATPTDESLLRFKGLTIDDNRKEVWVDGEHVSLTKTEYSLLRLMLKNKGKILSRQQLINQVWPHDVVVLDRTVDVNITRLRRKVKSYADHIITRQGFGYGFEI